jgi:hypothetical protein
MAWHLDRRVPIATIGAIIVQAVAFGWMASAMDGRITALEMYTQELKVARLRERMAVVENTSIQADEKFNHVDQQLNRLEDKIDRIADRVGAKK